VSFAVPGFAWALLALVPLAAAYFIRVRPRRQPVNALFLWERVLEQRTARSLFQRLRHLWSLLLMALVIAAAVLALMKPRFDGEESPDLLIVLDRSASMSGGEGGSRLDEAKRRIEGWIAALGSGQRAALVTADRRLEYRVHLTDKARPLLDALDAVEASDFPLDAGVFGELGLLADRGEEDPPVRVLFVSDGRSSRMPEVAGMDWVRVGEEASNIGITAADLRWEGPGRAFLFATVASTHAEAREVELELGDASGGRVARLFTMRIPARGEASESLVIEGLTPGAWTLRRLGEDDFAADDEVALGLNAPQAIPVRVESPNPFFFEQVVRAFAAANSMFEPVEDFAELGLVERGAPRTPVAVVFAPEGESAFWSLEEGELAAGAPVVVREEHPLIGRIDPALLVFEGARRLRAPEGAVVVLEHPSGDPLLYSAAVDGRRAVIVNLDPTRDGFVLSPWFPVLVHDAVALLTGREDEFPSAVPTGGRVAIPGTGEVAGLRRWRGGESESLEPRSPWLVERVGHYEMERSFTTWWAGGAVLDPGESGGASEMPAAVPVEPASGWPPALWLLALALLVAGGEEWLYHRRQVG